MESLVVLVRLGGAVCLLLFGLRLVRDGITETFGLRLKMALGLGTRSGPRAFLSGLVATLGLQSSTATALMTADFVDRQMIRPRMAQIVLLGANVGTALTAWVVSAGLTALSPVLILPVLWAVTGERPPAAAWAGALMAVGGMALIFLR